MLLDTTVFAFNLCSSTFTPVNFVMPQVKNQVKKSEINHPREQIHAAFILALTKGIIVKWLHSAVMEKGRLILRSYLLRGKLNDQPIENV